MAKKLITLLTDDLDGGKADRTVEFGIDGVAYTIDLSEKNIGKLRKLLDPYLAVGTRIARVRHEAPPASRTHRKAKRSHSEDRRSGNKSMREWAVKNGFEIAARGRIPRQVIEAYQNHR
jgi:hypothetical protein